MLKQGRTPGELKTVQRLGPVPESELQLGPRWTADWEPGSTSMSALKLGPGVKQMILEPGLVCEPELAPLEKLEPEEVLEPETAPGWDPVVVLVPGTVSGLGLVRGVMLESMTMSALETSPGGSLFPWRVFEMEMSHQE